MNCGVLSTLSPPGIEVDGHLQEAEPQLSGLHSLQAMAVQLSMHI